MPDTSTLQGQLKLEMTDVLGNDLNDRTAIELGDTRTSRRFHCEEQIQRTVTLTGIRCAPAAVLRVSLAPARSRPRQFFLALDAGRAASRKIVFPVQPGKVRGILAPSHSQLTAALQRLLPETAYAALDAPRKACLLNVAAKASASVLGDGKSCLEHLGPILSVRQDRLFARTGAALLEEVEQSPQFRRTSGLLHAAPAGYRRTRSFRSRDPHGSLQLTFFRRGETGDDYIVDADIDEAKGL